MFHYHCSKQRDMTICTASGRLTYNTLKALAMDFRNADISPKMLYDITGATAADLSTVEIEEIIKTIGQYMKRHRGGKAAIVAFSGVDYGLARLFGSFAEIAGLPFQVKVFRISEVAQAWLKDGPAKV